MRDYTDIDVNMSNEVDNDFFQFIIDCISKTNYSIIDAFPIVYQTRTSM